jgi:hypothetical protein
MVTMAGGVYLDFSSLHDNGGHLDFSSFHDNRKLGKKLPQNEVWTSN